MSKYLIQPFSVHTKSDISAYFIHFYEPASKNSYCFGIDNDRRKK